MGTLFLLTLNMYPVIVASCREVHVYESCARHIIQRGNKSWDVFSTDEDRQAFTALLALFNKCVSINPVKGNSKW
jgi:hypothetical protein